MNSKWTQTKKKRRTKMIGNTFQQLFLTGANELATSSIEYGPEQQAAGFTQDEWDLLTTRTCWTKSEQQRMPNIINSAVSITLRTAGLPSVPLPGAYVAAVICKLIAPCNRLLAAASSPESYDVMSASGIQGTSTKVITTKEQMYALVVVFSSAEFGALSSWRMNEEIAQAVLDAQIVG